MKNVVLVCLTVALLLAFCGRSGDQALARSPHTTVQVTHASSDVDDDLWRRTDNGWERMSDWPDYRPQPVPHSPMTKLHPGVVASLQLLVSLGGLLAFNTRGKSQAASKAVSP